MEDLAPYNDGCKAVSLLITILANVVIYRLLTRGRPWITKCVCACVCAYLVIQGRLKLVIDI